MKVFTSDMKWRLVGPFRGGRALAVQGVVDEPNVYYFGAVAGGVWKTTDGRTNLGSSFSEGGGVVHWGYWGRTVGPQRYLCWYGRSRHSR